MVVDAGCWQPCPERPQGESWVQLSVLQTFPTVFCLRIFGFGTTQDSRLVEDV